MLAALQLLSVTLHGAPDGASVHPRADVAATQAATDGHLDTESGPGGTEVEGRII